MYCVLDEYGRKVIAIHYEKETCEKYCELIERFHNIKLPIGKIKKKKLKKHPEIKKHPELLDDLFLVRYNDTYVQTGYVDVLEINSGELLHDYKYAKEILIRVLKIEDTIDKSARKAIEKSILLLDELYNDNSEFVPMLSDLQSYKMDNEAYEYNRGVEF